MVLRPQHMSPVWGHMALGHSKRPGLPTCERPQFSEKGFDCSLAAAWASERNSFSAASVSRLRAGVSDPSAPCPSSIDRRMLIGCVLDDEVDMLLGWSLSYISRLNQLYHVRPQIAISTPKGLDKVAAGETSWQRA